MTRADRVLSTPPTDSSSNNVAVSAADCVDSTRRAFLARAAVVAAGGAALGAALPLPGQAAAAVQAQKVIAPALRRPVLTMDGSGASDELRSAFRALDDAHAALKTAWAERKRVNALALEWEEQHPCGAVNNRAYRRWERRYREYRAKINYGPVGQAYYKARREFEEAKMEVALVKVRDIDELAHKACGVYAYEDTREGHLRGLDPMIAVSIAIDLARMSLPEGAGA